MRLAPTLLVLCAATGLALPLAAQARPYLILSADETGFKALDLGDAKRTPDGPNPADHTIVDRRPAPPPVTLAARGPVVAGAPGAAIADPYAPPREAALAGSAEDAPVSVRGPGVASAPRAAIDPDSPPREAALAGNAEASPVAKKTPVGPTPTQLADARNDARFLQEQIRAGRIIDDRDPVDRSAETVDYEDLNAQMMRFRPDTVQVNLIDAPAAGALIGERLAPMIRRRVEVSCIRPQWRTVSVAYLDAREKLLGEASTTSEWSDIAADDSVAVTVRTAACQRLYNAKAVSRYLNIGEILINFQAAHAKPAPQQKTREELLAERYRLNH